MMSLFLFVDAKIRTKFQTSKQIFSKKKKKMSSRHFLPPGICPVKTAPSKTTNIIRHPLQS